MIHAFVIDARSLYNLLREAEPIASRDETRVGQNLIDLEIGNRLIAARATDGHRVVRASVAGPAVGAETVHLRIQLHDAIALRKCLSACRGSTLRLEFECGPKGEYSGEAILSQMGAPLWRAVPSDAVPPPIDRIIPKTWKRAIVVNRKEALEAVQALSVKADRKDKPTLIVDAGERLLTLSRQSKGEVQQATHTPITITPKPCGSGIALYKGVFNASYIVQALKAMVDHNVEMRFGGRHDPLSIKGASSIHVVMPMFY